ncbi:MAG: GTPase HflX, partial [Oscillospiraceae bacterium]
LGGGIGTRGPGESKLETDRRHIRRRVLMLEQRLEEVKSRRELLRTRRKKDGVTTVAIIGYTNVGKSTLLNTLTEAGVLAEDMLFATLDPTARALTLPDGREVMLVDTVGLVRRLPHQLVEAFRSTLEEAANADLLLNLCDISSPDAAEQIEVARALLAELGAQQIPVLNVLNKCDKVSAPPLALSENTCLISAKTGFGLEALLASVARALVPTHTRLTLLLPYAEGTLTGELRARGRVFSEEFLPEGVRLDLMVDQRLLERAKEFVSQF